jgi:hypothetical protein
MPSLVFDDLERGRQVGISLGATFCGFYEKMDDTEVVFRFDDGCAILSLLEESLASNHLQMAEDNPRKTLLYRFRNLDGVDEAAAFLVRPHLGGIELTVVSGLEETDDLSDWKGGGMSVCISIENARMLAKNLASELNPSTNT